MLILFSGFDSMDKTIDSASESFVKTDLSEWTIVKILIDYDWLGKNRGKAF